MRPLRLFLLTIASLPSIALAAASDDFGDHPGFAHAMDVHTKVIDDFPVVFHYGEVRPDFTHGAETSTRQRRRFENGWKFRFDPKNQGSSEGWANNQMPEGNWSEVTVPHCWDMMPGGRFHDWTDTSPANPPHYNGAAWYRLEFDHTPESGKHHRIEFLGVQQRARIHLNGKEIALHEGGGQPFSINVTKHLRPGRNLLAVKVIRRPNFEPLKDGQKGEPSQIEQVHGPHPKAPDNWPYAGITREVSLITENPATLRKTLIRTENGALEVAAIVVNQGSEESTFEVALTSPAIPDPPKPETVELPAGRARVVKLKGKLESTAASWSPKTPYLHDFTVSLSSEGEVVDNWSSRFGIRSIAAEEGRMLLNEKPIFLKGVAMYEETFSRGAALRTEDHERLFEQCREVDANFIRLQVSQRAPIVYAAADELGFTVTAEWGGFWYREKAMDAQTKDSKSIFQSHARCAIWDLMNHPSVVLWCTHNESHQFCPEYTRFVAKATEIIRELDWQQRPVTWAAWHPHMGTPSFEHSDAAGFNEYRGAMDPFENLDPDMKRVTDENPAKPLIILENGAWSTSGKRGRSNQKGTEDWQADLLKRQHAVLTRHIPPLAGYTYWILVDYRSRKFYTAKKGADGYSRMGMYGDKGEVKRVRDVFRDLQWIPAEGGN